MILKDLPLLLFSGLLACLLVAAPLAADDEHDHAEHDHAHAEEKPEGDEQAEAKPIRGDRYPLDTCIVAPNSKLGSMGEPIVYNHEGREVRFCCAGCVPAFENDPERFLESADARIREQQSEDYPATKCPVGEMELGSMGDPIEIVWNNRLVKLCCAGCTRAFDSNPEKYVAKVDEQVVEAQKDDYPLDTCLVMEGESLDGMGGAVEFVHANQLVRLCCPGCKRDFNADPSKYMERLAEARASSDES